MTTLIIYIWDRLDSIIAGLFVTGFFLMIPISWFWFCLWMDGIRDTDGLPLGRFKRWAKIGLVLMIAGSLLPSSRGFAALVLLPGIIESEAIQRDMPELYEAAKAKLMDSLKD